MSHATCYRWDYIFDDKRTVGRSKLRVGLSGGSTFTCYTLDTSLNYNPTALNLKVANSVYELKRRGGVEGGRGGRDLITEN